MILNVCDLNMIGKTLIFKTIWNCLIPIVRKYVAPPPLAEPKADSKAAAHTPGRPWLYAEPQPHAQKII